MLNLKTTIQFGILATALATQFAFATQTNVTPIKNNDVVAQNPADDQKVVQTIQDLIHKSPTLSKLNVNVASNKGNVTLTGSVDSDSQVVSLVELSESVIGVSDVDVGNLKVKDSTQPMADALTTAKIKGILIREKLLGEKDIAAMNTVVETKDGVVYLSGVVDNKEQIKNAVDLIKKHVPEVKKVEYSVKQLTPTEG